MTLSPETQPVAQRSRTRWVVALAAILVLAMIAVVAVVAFVSLDLIRAPSLELDTGAGNPAIVAPAPTLIRPQLHSPPSTWDDDVG